MVTSVHPSILYMSVCPSVYQFIYPSVSKYKVGCVKDIFDSLSVNIAPGLGSRASAACGPQ